MSKKLSELLGAKEPAFTLSLRQLEAASGRPSADIRLSSEISRATKAKLKELGLDTEDTTGEELYAALNARIKADDERLIKTLRSKYGVNDDTSDSVRDIAKALQDVPIPKSCFGLKASVAKTLLMANPPKKLAKLLGYRSISSMIKHESPASLIAASWAAETLKWQRAMLESYKKLKAIDFEVRQISILHPSSTRWQKLAEELVSQKRNNVISLKEFGAVVILPLPAERPPVSTMATMSLALHAMNEIRANSTYLKLCQVKSDFGTVLQETVSDEAYLSTRLLEQPVSWQIIQRYYSRFSDAIKAEIFEPHVQVEDLSWHSIEKVLTYIEPSLDFWQHTSRLSFINEGEPVSFNIIDVALNCCNNLPYKDRIVRYFRHSLWHELVLRYLKHDTIEQSVLGQLQDELVAEPESTE